MPRLLFCIALLLTGGLVFADELPVAPPFSTDGLVLWLDADHHEAADGKLSTWLDRSGKGNHLVQPDTNLRPTIRQDGDATSIHFDQSALTLSKIKGFLSGEQTFQVFMLLRAGQQEAGSPRLIDLASSQNEAKYTNKRKGFWIGYEDYTLDPDSKGRMRLGVVAGGEATSSQKAWDSQPHIVEAVYAGNQRWALYEDGKSVGHGRYQGDVGFLGFVGGAQLTIGQHSLSKDPTHFFHGDVFEVLVFNRVLHAKEQQQVGQYLAQRLKDQTNYTPQDQTQPLFETHIQPLLANKCIDCHQGDEAKGGLRLDQLIHLYEGGTSGPILEPGNAQKSFLFHITASKEMPPASHDTPLTMEELELLRIWIESGAKAKQAVDLTALKQKTQSDHWAFQALQPPKLPINTAMHGSRTDIDDLIAAKLEKQGLTLSKTASKEVLLRRATLDLNGLPPSPQQIEEFLQDTRPNAYELLLDRLLASKHFGERWGRHWLDGVGYSDTNAMDNDQAIVRPAKGKWRYRDYVIDAFNSDKPYEDFLKQQLAGDAMVDWRDAKSYNPKIREHLVATTMLRCAPDDTDQNELNILSIRYHVLHRTAESVAQNLLGLTMQCCKCHDHKFEPISQRDYYRFTANFSGAWQPKDWLKPDEREIRIMGDDEVAGYEKQKNTLQSEIDSLIEVGRQALIKKTYAGIPAVLHDDLLAAQKIAKEKRSEVQKYLTEKFGETFNFNQAQVMPTLARETQLESDSPMKSTPSIQLSIRVGFKPYTMSVVSGQHLSFGEANMRNPELKFKQGFSRYLNVPPIAQPQDPSNPSTASHRLELAQQMTDWSSPTGALAARVRVNRVWQHLFGVGIVETAANFGVSGMKPTHPDVLEHLASYFVTHQRKLKPLLKHIMTSQVYMQVSTVGESKQLQKAQDLDPDNRLLWRQNLRRMEAEIIRDSVLFASGTLNPRMGGKFDNIVNLPNGMVVEEGYDQVTEELPGSAVSICSIDETTIPPSFKYSINHYLSRLVSNGIHQHRSHNLFGCSIVHSSITQANALARRVMVDAPNDLPQQFNQLFLYTLGRSITDEEIKSCTSAFNQHVAAYQLKDPEDMSASTKALARISQVIFSTNEFIYLQ